MRKKIQATYKREIEEKPVKDAVFSGLLVVVVVFIVFIFGIRPASLALTQNIKFRNELITLRDQMETKLEIIKQQKIVMEAYNEQIEKIKGGIPSERYVQQYLEEFVIDASKAGFVVTKFSRVEEFPDKIVLEIDLEGQPNNLPTLIDGIESSQRFASVNEIKTEKHEVSTKVRVVLEIFEI